MNFKVKRKEELEEYLRLRKLGELVSDVYPWPIRVQIIGSVVDDTTSLFTLEMVG